VLFPTSELCSSSDTVLTALAQLGAYQTNTERAFISLFDAGHQYTVAEATREQPLRPSLPGDQCVNPLWLCGTSIPRSHGVCELSLLGDPSPFQEPNPTHEPTETLPLTLSEDLTKDARFQHSPFCQPGGSARFYAAVPIRTRRGINIGVFCVMDSTPGKTWRDADTVRLHDISQTIMGHLETQRMKDLHRKSERMNRGMASFIEGKPAIYDKCESGGDTNATLEKMDEEVTGAADPDGSQPNVGSSKGIFSKAAKIICQSAEVESCFFFDASIEAYRVPSLTRINPSAASSRASATSSSDESLDADQLQELPCSQLLGCSLAEDADFESTAYGKPDSLMPEQFLGKLLQRYPRGKIFNFGADGELQTSDSSEDENPQAAVSPGVTESFPRINLADGTAATMKPPSYYRPSPRPAVWLSCRSGTPRKNVGSLEVSFAPKIHPVLLRFRTI
jgi:hypothetical protein